MVGSPKSPTHKPDEAEDMIDMRRRELLGIIIAGVAWPLTGRTQQRPERGRLLGVLLPSFEGDEVVPLAGVKYIDPDDQDGPGVRVRGTKTKR